jgi:hypothetical protein
MSRIDITVQDKNSGEVLINRAFCREPHLRVFCGTASDSEIQGFADELSIGVDLSSENIDHFLNTMRHVIQYLQSSIQIGHYQSEFHAPQQELESFTADLENALQFLMDLKAQKDWTQIETMIA